MIMMTEIMDKRNTAKVKEYESFVENHPNGNFMQSVSWTGVKNSWDYEIIIVRNNKNDITGTALVLIKEIPVLKRTFLYSPHGPVCDYKDRGVLEEIMEGIEILRRKYKAYEMVIDPCITENDREEIEIFKSLGFSF
jgi:lipid II:glycine glycyltransferase (peptidoglycan interpeptide bridge formation enzyme)